MWVQKDQMKGPGAGYFAQAACTLGALAVTVTSLQDVNIGKLAKTTGDLWIFFHKCTETLRGCNAKGLCKKPQSLGVCSGY